MRSSLAEMTSDCFGSSRNLSKNGSEITVLERQQSQMKFLQQQHRSSASETQYNDQALKLQASQKTQILTRGELGLLNPMMMLDPCLGWPEFGHLSMPKEMLHLSSDYAHDQYTLEMSTLTTAFSTGAPDRTATMGKEGDDSALTPKSSLKIDKENMNKRKTDQLLHPEFATESLPNDERIQKYTTYEDSNITLQSIPKKGRTSVNKVFPGTSKENSKTSEVTKPEYIHVRARRGQATDSHSLAERVRREKISQRMRFLQDLVPGCNKIIGKAGMLDEIINYVQALQRQVEFLSMKLAVVTIAQDFNNGNNDPVEVHMEAALRYPRVSIPDAPSHAYLPFNQPQASNALVTAQNSSNTVQSRTTSAPASSHNNFAATAGFTPLPTWDADFQAVPGLEFHQRRSTTIPSQPTEGDASCMSNQFTMF